MRSVKWRHFQRPSMTAKPDFKGHSNIWCETERQLQWTITINRYLHVPNSPTQRCHLELRQGSNWWGWGWLPPPQEPHPRSHRSGSSLFTIRTLNYVDCS